MKGRSGGERCADINKPGKQGKKERGEQPHALDVFDLPQIEMEKGE